MEAVLDDWGRTCDGVYLYANGTVLELSLIHIFQPVEKPALAIRPEQVFCLKTRRQEEKAVKCQAHFRAIWTVCRHPCLLYTSPACDIAPDMSRPLF